MSTVITSVDHRSPAQRAGDPGREKLLTINGHEIVDVLDYRFYGYDAKCRLELLEPNGSVRNVQIKKEEGLDLGLNFDTYLMDEMRCCANHCVFCFVDQMPPGMRQTLYFKDDDARLSFLQGNYITLTNLTEAGSSASLICTSGPSTSPSTPRTPSSLHHAGQQERRALSGIYAPVL